MSFHRSLFTENALLTQGAGTRPVGPAQAGPIFTFAAILKLLFGWNFSVETIQLVSTLFQSLLQ